MMTTRTNDEVCKGVLDLRWQARAKLAKLAKSAVAMMCRGLATMGVLETRADKQIVGSLGKSSPNPVLIYHRWGVQGNAGERSMSRGERSLSRGKRS